MEAIILVPAKPVINESFRHKFTTTKQGEQCRALLLNCHPHRPGVVWRFLRPCLLRSPKRVARQAILCLLEALNFHLESVPRESRCCDATIGEFCGKTLRRKVLLVNDTMAPRKQLIIWIQPPSTTYFHKYFTYLLLTWEHQMILYQSMAAWISTLGGGYFFCRHLSTALTLAQKQLKIALLMGDYTMAYKCIINQAYSYIYSGQFQMALDTIDKVDILNKKVDHRPLDLVIVNMQKSARLFCKRFRRASKKLMSSSQKREGQAPPLTSDDYQRIRIVEDQSGSKKHNR